MDLIVTLTGANGDSITFDNTTYTLTEGVTGLGVPATNLKILDSATDGGIFRNTKRGVREMTLPILVVGSDRADTETKLRRLSNILRNTSGPATLTADNGLGSVWALKVYYASGADAQRGEESNQTFARWVVTLQSADPFWTSQTAYTFSVVAGGSGRGLLPRLSNLRVTTSQAVGTVTVNNTDGDVPSYPIWTVYGPFDNLTVTAGGVGFAYTAAIPAGTVVTIDTAKGTVTDAAGANLYGNLGVAPKLFTLPPGVTSVYVSGNGATSASQIACTYYPRREVLH